MKSISQTRTLVEILKQFLYAQGQLSPSAWSAAKKCFTFRSFDAGEHLIDAGQLVKEIGFLVGGLARYYYLTPEGKEFNKSFAQTGQPITSVISLVAGEPSPFSVQALEPCRCAFIGYADVSELCDAHRDWDRLARHLLEQLAIKKERREADFLLLSATERYQKFVIEFADMVDRIPNYHIASYLGITEVGLSRIRRRLGLVPVNPG